MHYTCDMSMLLNRDFDSITLCMFDIVIVFAIIYYFFLINIQNKVFNEPCKTIQLFLLTKIEFVIAKRNPATKTNRSKVKLVGCRIE